MEQGVLMPGEAPEVLAERKRLRAEERRAANQMAKPRLLRAQRNQVEMRMVDLEGTIAPGHRVRALWDFVERLDLRRFYVEVKARGSNPGRPSSDPKMLVALWLYATVDGVGSARELTRLCNEHDVYRWIRGGVPVNYHTLADFRTEHEEGLYDLFTGVVAAMLHEGLVSLKRVAQDGTRVRASAGSGSFRRRLSLEKCLEMARAQVAAVRAQAATVGETHTQRQQRARERAARERLDRVERAIKAHEQVQADREATKKGANDPKTPPRGSTTDPDARKMRMGDGGSRPAYNVQFASDTTSRVVVGFAVSQSRTDFAEGPPMMEQIHENTGERPEELLVDTGYTSKEAIEKLSQAGVRVYGTLPERKGRPDPYAPNNRDSPEMREFRERMRTEEAKEIYKKRAPVAELVNADLKTWRTLGRFTVRGTRKVSCVVLWNVLAHTFLRWVALSSPAT